MTQPFGSCAILFSASLALAAPATNVATAPRQVASSNLRIAKPPTLFQVLFYFRTGLGYVQRQRLIPPPIPKVVRLSVAGVRYRLSKTHRQFQYRVQSKPEQSNAMPVTHSVQ